MTVKRLHECWIISARVIVSDGTTGHAHTCFCGFICRQSGEKCSVKMRISTQIVVYIRVLLPIGAILQNEQQPVVAT